LRRLASLPATASVVICKGQQIPSGYVIVAEGSSISCPGNFPNTWTIKQPALTETVCSVSPVPNGYVVVGTGSSISCPGNFPNTKTIRKV
jgi:hypothetical protein